MLKKVIALGASALVLAPTLSIAAPVSGPDYTADQIRAFTVAGVRLGMTADEAQAAMVAGGFEGRFGRFDGTERSASVWVQVDQQAAPFRYLGKDGKVRVFEMTFEQRFDRPQSIQALKDLVVAKYGPPTEAEVYAEQGKLTYHGHFTVDHEVLNGWCAGYRPDPSTCPPAQRAALESEAELPTFTVTITPTKLRASAHDEGSLQEGEAASRAAADAARENKAVANTKSTKLGL